MRKTSDNQEKGVGEEVGGNTGGSVGESADGSVSEAVGGISDLIYRVRGREVMLDADLARIYGYTTKAFNQQVMRNREKFEGEEFMFQLTWEELNMVLRCKNCTLNEENDCSRCQIGTLNEEGDFLRCQNGILNMEEKFSRSQNVTLKETSRGGNIKYLPYAFTEQGVYMLMTVLKGELAVRQSRALVMAFKAMKDYILENRELLNQREQLKMLSMVVENNRQLGQIDKKVELMDKRLIEVEAKAEEAVLKNEIAPVMLDFNKFNRREEFVFMNGMAMEAKEFYQDIYGKAKKNVVVIDDYIDIRTLRLLGKVRDGVEVTVFSDNVRNYLHASDVADFRREFPKVKVRFIKTMRMMHDRFVIIDYGESRMEVYHCGGSSKDAGRGVTMVLKVEGELAKKSIEMIVEGLMRNGEVEMK